MTPDPVSQNDTSYEAQVLASKKLKKRILIVLGASVGAVLVLLLLVLLLQGIQRSMNTPEVPEYEFYPTYTGDIQKNPAYLNLDREVVYAYDATGVGFSTTITEEEWDSFDGEVKFLYQYLQNIIAGDVEAYNACLSERYIREFGREDLFSPQMLYEMKISFYRADADGGKVYLLEYKIYHNDGSFRTDVGSGMSRPQFVKVIEPSEGQYKIENIATRFER